VTSNNVHNGTRAPAMAGRDLLICAGLALLAIAVYWRVGACGFVCFDDDKYIVNNPYVAKGFSREGIAWAFGFTEIAYWHPLTWLSYMLDSQLFGVNPAAFHLTNVLLHLASGVVLFLALRRMTADRWRSGFVAALFVVHPLNVESVAWVAERKDVLSGLFWMLTLLGYAHYVERPSPGRYVTVLATFVVGLMAKPMLTTLPCVLLLLDYWPLRRVRLEQLLPRLRHEADADAPPAGRHPGSPPFRLFLEKVPFFAFSATSVYLSSASIYLNGTMISSAVAPLKLRVANALVTYLGYLGKMAWPRGLAVFHPYPESVPQLQATGALALLAALSVLVVARSRKAPFLLTGWLWYAGTLVPVSGLMQNGLWPAMADRFVYVPSIGIYLMVAWGAPKLLGNWRFRNVALAALAAAALAALATCAHLQTRHWQNSVTLFARAVAVTENNAMAHHNLGAALADEGNLDGAIRQYRLALEAVPDHAFAHNNLGVALETRGQHEEALRHYLEAVRIRPKYADPHANLGRLFSAAGRLTQAAYHYTAALRCRPGAPGLHNDLGTVLARKGQFGAAARHFQEALRLDPTFAGAAANLANARAWQERQKSEP